MKLATSSTVLKFHDWPSCDTISSYTPLASNESTIKTISWNRDGGWIVIVSPDGVPEVISVTKDVPKQLLAIRDIPANCAAFQNTSKRFVAIGTLTKEILVYDIKSKSIRQCFEACKSPIKLLECTAKDSHIVAGCANGEIRLYSRTVVGVSESVRLPKSTCCTTLRCHHSKRNLVLAGSAEGIVCLYDMNTSKATYTSDAHVAEVTGLTFCTTRNDIIASGGLDRRLVFHDVISGKHVAQIALENSATAVDFAPDGLSLVVGGQNGKIYVYDTRAVSKPVNIFEAHSSRIKQLLFQRDSEDHSGEPVADEDIFTRQTEPTTSEPMNNKNSVAYNSFGYFPSPLRDSPLEKASAEQPQVSGDSFMAAVEANFENSINSSMSYGKICLGTSGASNAHEQREPLQRAVSITSSSTPKTIPVRVVSEEPACSPVIGSSICTACNGGDNQALMNNTLQNEKLREIFREELARFKKEMRYEMYETAAQMRRNFLDLHLSMAKEFSQVETNLTKLKHELLAEEPCYSEDILLQENYRLKRELMLLKEKMAKKE